MAESPEPGCLSECRRVQGEGSLVRATRAGAGPKEGVSGVPTSSHFPQQAAECSGAATPTPTGCRRSEAASGPLPSGPGSRCPGKGLPES